MLDEDARRALEEEAIALVNLSNPSQFEEGDAAQPPAGLAGVTDVTASATATDVPDAVDAASAAMDDNMSMRSLLGTLKKRKLAHKPRSEPSTAASPAPAVDAAVVDAAKLPSFRALFIEPPTAATSAVEAVEPSVEAAADVAEPEPQLATSAELKCKYRTGKCHNARALKSCGDYHNLCNYHRLRANANQRKLDRKKKVQRLQLSVALASPSPSPTDGEAGAAAGVATAVSSSHAAAAALVAMPSALAESDSGAPLTQPQAPPQALRYDPKTLVPYLVAQGEESSGRLRVKQQDACSY